ncbi:DUF2071 domain-containing protein [Nesterenkonia pannonica]|uniref:YqjF family protein n=1 Tax=Nesterenkonia pannonica TaxID=1548602 RepID=UPI0021643D78|nr:DUF2071 domain-containing protein [Nesterenkonia pannonica]
MNHLPRQPPPLGSRAILGQRWSDVVFLHWRVDPEAVEPFMPPGCSADVFDGDSWVGLVGFQMSDSSFFGGPRIPWLGSFPEVNVRLYSVDAQSKRGVVFRSLEASHLVPVMVARAAFGLRYQWASMKRERTDDEVAYRTVRHGRRSAASEFAIRPTPEGAREGEMSGDPLSTFLTARWGFHERRRGRTIYCRNHHEPWPLQRAELLRLDDGLLEAAGFAGVADRKPESVLYAPAVRTVFAAPQTAL